MTKYTNSNRYKPGNTGNIPLLIKCLSETRNKKNEPYISSAGRNLANFPCLGLTLASETTISVKIGMASATQMRHCSSAAATGPSIDNSLAVGTVLILSSSLTSELSASQVRNSS